MKKSLILVGLLILTAGVSYAGDSFSIVIGPGGFGLSFGGAFGLWPPPPPPPPPGFFAGWRALPYWGRPPHWKSSPHHGTRYYRQRFRAPRSRHLTPGGGDRRWHGGGEHFGFRKRR
jgi:hypothetical protein